MIKDTAGKNKATAHSPTDTEYLAWMEYGLNIILKMKLTIKINGLVGQGSLLG